MSQISLYKNNRDVNGFDPVDVKDIYDCIKSGHWDKFVQPVRRLEYKSSAYDAAKNQLPAFTMSGVFPKGKRANESIVSHSGRIAIDIDGLKDSVEDVKQQLIGDEYSEGVGLSVGGRGLVVVVKIDGSKHVEVFEQLEQHYLESYGLHIDASCKNVARIRYVTSDPDFYINYDSEEFQYKEPVKQQMEAFLPTAYNSPSSGSGFDERVKLSISKEIIRRSVAMIDNAQRGHVHNAIMRASELGGGYISGGLVDEMEFKNAILSSIASKPKSLSRKLEEKKVDDGIRHGKTKPINELMVEKKPDQTVRKFKDYGVDWKKMPEAEKQSYKEVISLAHEKNRAGDKLDVSFLASFAEMQKLPKDKVIEVYSKVYELNKAYFNFDNKAHVQKAEIHINENWELRYNTVKNTVDYRTIGAFDFKELKIDNIYRNLQHNRIKYSMSDLKSLLNSDFVEEYDPIDNYFENLKEWDGVDYIEKLASHINVKRQDFFNVMLKKHLVRAVKCGLGKGVNRYLFTIVGEKQSTGKTYFLRWLCPFENDYYTEASISAKDKDTKIAVAKNFIYNIDELASLRKMDIDALKSLISSDKITERLPYGSSAVTMRRRANFFASTNNMQILTDIENTRWLVFELLGINRDYRSTMDIHNVWAQAFSLYRDEKYSDQLTKEEESTQEGVNKDFNVSSPEEEAIKSHYKVVEAGQGEFFSVFDITNRLVELYPSFKFNAIAVGRSMKTLGFLDGRKSLNGQRVRGYFAKNTLGEYKEEDKQAKIF
ncbi:hypothetical protein KAU11_08985 [Candidatus Babeliales bacterium]|nr:hypothetical protein [Candidatus Babeliales bacterium]